MPYATRPIIVLTEAPGRRTFIVMKKLNLYRVFEILPFIFTLAFALSILGCGTPPKRSNGSSGIEDNLTMQDAEFRRKQIDSVDYTLHFDFANQAAAEQADTYSAEVTIDVDLAILDKPLRVDTDGHQITKLIVNGQTLPIAEKTTGWILIPPQYLTQKNSIQISYSAQFKKTGKGLQRIVDSEDGSTYIYSNSEPYFAHTFFPCFDQPDLKATYTLKVNAPAKWRVIGNSSEISSVANNGVRTVSFNTTKKFSTYLFFVGAGPFARWTGRYNNTPIHLYARKTLAKYVDSKRIIHTIQAGLNFFESYFDMPYPFQKYDQVFVPEFNHGAMENPGAVTFNERFIYRGKATDRELANRDNIILHEMAHMWFGNLVTMTWWDNLWLNESFADFMANYAMKKKMKNSSTELSEVGQKSWAYWQDLLVTTHPIETPVIDTRSARGYFDGITYAKGGSALKQLQFFVGEDKFRDGVRSYFKKFAWQNTVRADFINEISQAAQMDLSHWTKQWLQTAGPNTVSVQFECSENKISKFDILQKPSSSGNLSPHRTEIALFKKPKDKSNEKSIQKWPAFHQFEVTYSEAKTPVPAVIGLDCPDFVFPNLGNYDYAIFQLDKRSLENARYALIGHMDDPAVRLMTWQILSQMIKDQTLSLSKYFELAQDILTFEYNTRALEFYLGRHSAIVEYYYTYLTKDERQQRSKQIENVTWRRIQNAKPGSKEQIILFDFYVKIAQSDKAAKTLSNIIDGQNIPKKLDLDQDRRWNILIQLAKLGAENIRVQIEKEKLKDPSHKGVAAHYTATVALPDTKTKKMFWETLQAPESVPFQSLKSAAAQFHNSNDPALTEIYKKAYFDKLSKTDWKVLDDYLDLYFEYLFPHHNCTASGLQESESYLAKSKNLAPLAKRAWREANDQLSKCVGAVH